MPVTDLHLRLIPLLTGSGRTTADLANRLGISERQIQLHLANLRQRHPSQCRRERDGRHQRHRWIGEAPVPVPNPVATFSIQDLLALATARGVLAQPGRDPGPLARALDELIDRSGLRPEIRNLTPDTIEVATHARVVEDPAHLQVLVEAIRTREPVRFTYTTSEGRTHAVHAVPARLRMVASEWHVVAWAVSQTRGPGLWPYRLARISDLTSAATHPEGWRPPSKADLDSHGRGAFGATAGQTFERVVLGIDPGLMPHVSGRTWGLSQTLAPAPDLGPGWHRLAFRTAGLSEAKHKVLSWGALVRVEAPESLKKWLREQATAILAALPQ